MRNEFLKKEFEAAGAKEYREYITIAEFKAKYGEKVINDSDKCLQFIKSLENERDIGVSNGDITYDDFSYMYMFLDFGDKKKHKKRVAKEK